MNQTGKVLKIVLLLSIVLNGVLGYKYYKLKYRYNPDYSFNRKGLFEHLTIDSSSIVFMGNSLTAQFELAELFKKSNMRNRGINGERTDGLLYRLPMVIRAHPKKVFIEIGINDIGQGIEKAAIIDNYKKILSKLQMESPVSKIYVQSILPVYNSGPAVTTSSMNNEAIRDVNKDLQDYCKLKNISFINLYDSFNLDGQMNPKYCLVDGLHISGEGYLLWTQLLKQYVDND